MVSNNLTLALVDFVENLPATIVEGHMSQQTRALTKEPGGVWCFSGKHFWTEKCDAEKCCHPGWKRILLVGSEAKNSDNPKYDVGARSWYGHKWVQTDA